MTALVTRPRRATARTARNPILGLLDRFLAAQVLVGSGHSAWHH